MDSASPAELAPLTPAVKQTIEALLTIGAFATIGWITWTAWTAVPFRINPDRTEIRMYAVGSNAERHQYADRVLHESGYADRFRSLELLGRDSVRVLLDPPPAGHAQ